HDAGGDEAEEGRDLELLQQVVGREEAGGVEAAGQQQHDDEADGDGDRAVDGFQHRLHQLNSSRRVFTRNTRAAPRLTAPSSTTPWNRGCHSGGRSKTNSRSSMVRRMKAPKIEPTAPPAPP